MSINIQTENNKLKKIAGTYGTNNTVVTDSELSLDSENPIQNKVITKELNNIEDTVATIRLTKEYIQEHNNFSSFINGLKENTCYIFSGTNSSISEMNILTNLGFSPKQGVGNIRISVGFSKYNIFVEFNDGGQVMKRIISYNPNASDNYSISNWFTFITTDDTVKHAESADNADTVDGYHVNDSPSADPRGKIPIVKSDGVIEVGKYIDFHVSTTDWDNDARITAGYDKMEIDKPIESPGVKTSSLIVSKSFSGYSEPQFVVENPTYPNAKVIGYVDQEGANFRLQCNEGSNYYEFDTLGNSLRLYHYYDGATPTLISSVGSGEELELQIARATKDGDGNVIKDTYLKKNVLNVVYGGGYTSLIPQYGGLLLLDYHASLITGMYVTYNEISPFDYKNANNIPRICFGNSGRPWNGFYSFVGMSTVSDRNQKKNIQILDGDRCSKLIKLINAVSYKLIENDSDRTHYGMISQQVEDVLIQLGIDSKDFAGFIKSPVMEDIMEQDTNENGELVFDEDDSPVMKKIGERETGEYTYMLRYEEFIPILWKNAQDKNKQIEELQQLNQENVTKINELEQRIAKLEEYINNTI